MSVSLDDRIRRMDALALSFTQDIREAAINEIYSTLIGVFNNVDSLIAIVNSDNNTLEYVNPAGIEHDIKAGTNIRNMLGEDCKKICEEISFPFECDLCPLAKAKKDNKVHSISFMRVVTKVDMVMTVIPLKINGTSSYIVTFGVKDCG